MRNRGALKASILALALLATAVAPVLAHQGRLIAANGPADCGPYGSPKYWWFIYGTGSPRTAGSMLFGFEYVFCADMYQAFSFGVDPAIDPNGDGTLEIAVEQGAPNVTYEQSQAILEELGLLRAPHTLTGSIGSSLGPGYIPVCDPAEEADYVLTASGDLLPWAEACPGA